MVASTDYFREWDGASAESLWPLAGDLARRARRDGDDLYCWMAL
ncbi:hypothetical protein [Streptomyces sp. XM4011]|nr:hypothetical protein [Streptomyces sp. XM4011]